MNFFVLPNRFAEAPVNMADDMVLLQDFPSPSTLRFRHYEWIRPCWTYGYGQSLKSVLKLMKGESLTICRRLTGGGLIRHGNDWAYSLVIPTNHPMYYLSAPAIYKSIHEALKSTLGKYSISVDLAAYATRSRGRNVWNERDNSFNHVELNDLVLEHTTQKVAGAAQRKSRMGILIQGIINKEVLPRISWTAFEKDYVQKLAEVFEATLDFIPWPEYSSVRVLEKRAVFEGVSWNSKH